MTDNLRQDFAKIIMVRLRELGWTQHELATRVGMSESRVSRIIAGDLNITLRTATRLIHATGASLEFTYKSRNGPAALDP